MAERSFGWQTNGTGDGPSAGYTMARWYDFIRKLFASATATDNEGVIFGVGSVLAVSGAASPLSIATGAAILAGLFYENTTVATKTVTTPVVGTTGGIVKLQSDYAAQTIRIVVAMSADGTPDIPTLTQTIGTTYEIPLASFTITTGGVITLTDARIYAHFRTPVSTGMIETAAVIAGKLASDAVTTVKILDANVTTAKLAADSVDDTKVGNRVPQFYRRQGGSATDWDTAGITDRTPGAVRMQAGSYDCGNLTGPSNNLFTITFPTAFSYAPLVFLSMYNQAGQQFLNYAVPNAYAIEANQFNFNVAIPASGVDGYYIHWMAVGPE